jgi:protein-S-isoprenylcysteine O-methyltransferase Ste14
MAAASVAVGIRGAIFTILVPFCIAWLAPLGIAGGDPVRSGWWQLGWLPVAIGTVVYLICLIAFVIAGGTPAIFFTRPIRFLLGEEPDRVVQSGLYRWSRNPMYLAVVLVVFGQALLFSSLRIAIYGVVLFAIFHLVVVFLEEPHLKAEKGKPYEEYMRATPRWIGRRG